MNRRKLILISLILIIVLASSFYLVFVLDLPHLIPIAQKLGIGLSWQAYDEYLRHRLIGMSSAEVHALLREIEPGLNFGRSKPQCESVQLMNSHAIYNVCYSNGGVVLVERET